MDRLIIFDTTLRDGEQAAGGGLSMNEKLEIAKQLDRLGVDVIEAGFPANSPEELETVRLIAHEIRRPVICALSHADTLAIDKAWEAVREASSPRIHVFLSASDIHLSYQLHKSHEEVMELAQKIVARAKSYAQDVEFSPMDATRAEPSYLYKLLEVAIEMGATTLNIPDTVGYAIPGEFGDLISGIRHNVPHIDRVCLSVHCHDDLGLAVANSLEAVERGARQVECTINGIGERAGNASLEEVVMTVNTRQDLFPFSLNIDTREIYKTSRLVSNLTGFSVQPNKAIVGENAFRHQSGLHQDGMVKEASTYEIMKPQEVGVPGSELTMGKLSGRKGFRERLTELGYELSEDDFKLVFESFKELSTKKKAIADKDIVSLIDQEKRAAFEVYHLDQIHVSCGDHDIPTATVRLISPEGIPLADAALGTGPVDAGYKAINRIVGVPNKLIEFNIKSITEGLDAIGEVLIRIESGGKVYTGRGSSTDIIVASAKAYLNALNRLLVDKGLKGASR